MNSTIRVAVVLGLSGLIGSLASAQKSTTGNFKNVVIGSGCASTCINGVCEKICNGEKVEGEAQVSAGNDSTSAKDYGFTDFKQLDISGFDANIEYGEEFSVLADGRSSDLQNLKVDLEVGVEGVGVLRVSVDGNVSLAGALKIVTPELERVSVAGETDVTVSGFESAQLTLNAAENSDITLSNNSFEELILTASGNADIDMSESKVGIAKVDISGNSDVELNFTETNASLEGRVSGNSDLEYCGNPKSDISVSGDMADATQRECD